MGLLYLTSESNQHTMWKTVFTLSVTIVVIPILAFSFDDALTALQHQFLTKLVLVYLAAALLCFVVSSLRNTKKVFWIRGSGESYVIPTIPQNWPYGSFSTFSVY